MLICLLIKNPIRLCENVNNIGPSRSNFVIDFGARREMAFTAFDSLLMYVHGQDITNVIVERLALVRWNRQQI